MQSLRNMFPYQPTWSNTRINLLQRCSRAFVLRYGLAQISRNHPQGQLLSEAFRIQTPWILMHQTIRDVVLDYVEDYTNGTVWSQGLIRVRFKKDYTRAILGRNKIIESLQNYEFDSTFFQITYPEDHLIKMGVEICINILQHKVMLELLSDGSIERKEPTNSIVKQKVRLYCSPDLIHHGKNGTTLVKLHLYGRLSAYERINQASLLQLYGNADSTVIQFTLERRKWYIHKTKPVAKQVKQALDLVHQDIKHMETSFSNVNKNNDLTKVPLADTYRSCMHCNVRFMCPSRHGYENAKAEQLTLMCE